MKVRLLPGVLGSSPAIMEHRGSWTVASNDKKSKFLGIPHGTACGRLRQRIILYLLRQLGQNFCYRCGQRIENAQELSIEHKKPWEGRDPALFWDLDNVAFSHRVCNRPHRPGGWAQRYVGEPGTAWCTVCKTFRLVERFRKDSGRWNGLDKKCSDCHREMGRRRRARRASNAYP